MARVHTLKDRIRAIIRAYKKISGEKFLYNRAPDLRKRFHRIRVWFLLNSPSRGYSIMRMEFTRKAQFTVHEWHNLFSKGIDTKEKHYASLYSIFTQAVLPAINTKGGNDWRFISVLCWTGIDDIRQGKDSTASRKRNRPTKKRHANARKRNRR